MQVFPTTRIQTMLTLTISCALLLLLVSSPAVSALGFHLPAASSSFLPSEDYAISIPSVPAKIVSAQIRTRTTPENGSIRDSTRSNINIGRNIQSKKCSSRRELMVGTMLSVTGAMLLSLPAYAAETTPEAAANFEYELANPECQTACFRECQLRNTNKQTKGDCIDACVRNGQRYCHPSTVSKSLAPFSNGAVSKYVITTQEPTITSSKPIPGLEYNSNRGGAWRD